MSPKVYIVFYKFIFCLEGLHLRLTYLSISLDNVETAPQDVQSTARSEKGRKGRRLTNSYSFRFRTIGVANWRKPITFEARQLQIL